MAVNEKSQTKREEAYLNALKHTYHAIFEMDAKTKAVRCIYSGSGLAAAEDEIRTSGLKGAIEFWTDGEIVDEDRARLEQLVENITALTYPASVMPHEFELKVATEHAGVKFFYMVCLGSEDDTILVCLKDISEEKYSVTLKREAKAFRRLYRFLEEALGMQAFGTFCFSISEGRIYPIFASEKLIRYFNVNMQKVLGYMQDGILEKSFLDAIPMTYDEYEELLEGKTIAIETLLSDQRLTKMQLLCRPINDGKEEMYGVMVKPFAKEARQENVPVSFETPDNGEKRIFIRTFGHFDVFVDGKAIRFSNAKEKELLALLVDRNGGTVTSAQAVAYLWENEEASDRVMTKYRKLAMNLRKTLERYGIEHIINNLHGTRSIQVSAVECDYYGLLAGNSKYRRLFHDAYMTDYSWAEETLSNLLGRQEEQ